MATMKDLLGFWRTRYATVLARCDPPRTFASYRTVQLLPP
ncbi:hypothetical protein FTUN_7571 [Frigoriglobus tundricola]|uniref:Uncharacterized protein n=1 Tax=Frigoriglobus tundricola TaxID=2774151 RepID=A0A6M5Z1A6_9BACT|nr:hypothetical protein FTUN_7571 [Frigoriglobus tundricola]